MPIIVPPSLEPLATDVALRVVGALPELVLNQLGHAIRDFCTRSTAWREAATVAVVAGTRDYTPTVAPVGVRIMHLMAAAVDGIPLGRWDQPYGSATLSWGSPVTPGPPALYGAPSPGALRIWPAPDKAYSITLDVSVAPAPETNLLSVVFPAGFLAQYHETLAAGALARLYAIPNVPFTSQALAQSLSRVFSRGIVAARVGVEASLSRGFQPVRFFPRPAGVLSA